jgi:phenylacetate-CoA ligase
MTSGTTGRPLVLYRSESQEVLRKALVWRHYQLAGFSYKEPRVTLGRPLDLPEQQVYYRHDRLENNLELNTFHLNPDGFRRLYDVTLAFKPKMITGHPAALYTFCLQIERLGLKSIPIDLIFCVSERVYKYHLERFAKHFGGRVYDYYGNRENTVFVSQLPCGNYHINSEACLVEVINDDSTANMGEIGRIISTPLENYAVPLLRYDSGDFGKLTGKCSRCAIAHPTMSIVGGRQKDALVTRNGYFSCHLDTYLTRAHFQGADYLQVVQKDLDNVVIRILANAKYERDRDEAELRRMAEDCLQGEFTVKIEYIDKPPFTEAGKMPYVVNEAFPKQS